MTARTEPVEVIGAVAVFAPTGTSPYYRLKWREPDGLPGDTTGGRTLDDAVERAEQIDDRLLMAAGPQATTTLDAMATEYRHQGRSPHGDRPWSDGYAAQVKTHLNRMLREHGALRAMDVTRRVIDEMRAEGGTKNVVKSNATHLRAFLLWGATHQPPYFTPEQAAMLPERALPVQPRRRGTAAPPRRGSTRQVGDSTVYIRDEDAPRVAQVQRLGQALGEVVPDWGRLAPEVAATIGPRWGEQFQLTAHDIHRDGCAAHPQPHGHIDWEVNPAGKTTPEHGRRSRPKGDKTRVVPIPVLSITGYPLREELLARCDAALAEQNAGRNPEALLFPAARGGMQWHSSFSTDLLIPAMREADWPLQEWVETREVWSKSEQKYQLEVRNRVQARLPWHSLRHRFARTMIDVYHLDAGQLMAAGGWENIQTVQDRYYRSGKEHTDRVLQLFT
jgi:integrase